MPVLEPADTPIQKLLETVGQGENPDGDDGFCKQTHVYSFAIAV